jgi:hypothetical protein
MVVKNEFWLVKSTILRVKKHKTCKIGFKTRKSVKSVKPGQTRIKSGQPVKNVKSVSISRFHVKLKFKRVCHLSCWIVDCCAYADSSLPSPNSQCPLPTPHSPPVTRHSTVHPSSLPLSLSPFPFPLSIRLRLRNWLIRFRSPLSPLTSSAVSSLHSLSWFCLLSRSGAFLARRR